MHTHAKVRDVISALKTETRRELCGLLVLWQNKRRITRSIKHRAPVCAQKGIQGRRVSLHVAYSWLGT